MTAPEFTAAAPAAALDRLRSGSDRYRSLPRWPLILIALPAAVAVWSGWVGLGTMCGFGIVHPLPGIWDSFKLNSAITLPIGVEAYGAYALAAWLHPGTMPSAKRFAQRSGIGALALGMGGQVIYHLLTASHQTTAPWPVVMLVSCLPVVTLGFGTALTHLMRDDHTYHADDDADDADDEPRTVPAGASAAAPAGTPARAAVPAAAAVTAPTWTANRTPAPAASRPPVADRSPSPATDRPPAPAANRPPAPKQRTQRGMSTAVRVARMRDRHPDESPADIARRLSLSDRTVRRYWTDDPDASTA